jgi:hypothetical protein
MKQLQNIYQAVKEFIAGLGDNLISNPPTASQDITP